MKSYVLDASALMTFFEDRPGADQVRELLSKAGEVRAALFMSVVNWGEVFYSIWRTRGEEAANEKLGQIADLPIEIVGVDTPTAKEAATLKAKFGLPYVDCFAAAISQQRKATLVTADKDFELVEKYVKILWAGKP